MAAPVAAKRWSPRSDGLPLWFQSSRRISFNFTVLLTLIHIILLMLQFPFIPPSISPYYDATNHDRFVDIPNTRPQTRTVDPKMDRKLRMRFDWTNLLPLSALARRIDQHQANCELPLANFQYRNRFGLGSDLHVWGQAMCNAMEANVRLRTALPWIWLDDTECSSDQALSGMICYFPRSELQCHNDAQDARENGARLRNMTRARGRVRNDCQHTLAHHNATISDLRAATTEFLFTRVAQRILEEAERQLNLVFATLGRVPDNLITVHIRWGDKGDEMRLVPVADYVRAVQQILDRRAHRRSGGDRAATPPAAHAHVFLATEDPRAVQEFTQAAPVGWHIYLDHYYREFLPHRRESYNGSPLMSQDLQGHPGLVALGSLLVAMEANDFVLTTASNWSRLLNELRMAIVHPRCGNCTTYIDLKRGEW